MKSWTRLRISLLNSCLMLERHNSSKVFYLLCKYIGSKYLLYQKRLFRWLNHYVEDSYRLVVLIYPKKTLFPWDILCQPKLVGVLNISYKAALCKLLWNVYRKKDKLWVVWTQTYYEQHDSIWEEQPK